MSHSLIHNDKMADRYEYCAICRHRTNPVRYRMRTNTDLRNVINEQIGNLIPLAPNASIRNQCYRRHRDLLNNRLQNNADEAQNIDNERPNIDIDIPNIDNELPNNDNELMNINDDVPNYPNAVALLPAQPAVQALQVPNIMGEKC